MTTAMEIVIAILRELTRIQNIPAHLINEGQASSMPGWIATGSDSSIIVSHEIDAKISSLAVKFMREDRTIRSRFTQKEWIAAVRETFGPVLAAIDLNEDLYKNATIVIDAVCTATNDLKSIGGVQEHIFGCTLFGHHDAEPIEIGPARFENRRSWLQRISENGALANSTKRRLELRWQGQRLRKRKASLHSIIENSIADTIGDCPYVFSVKIEGLAMEAAHQRALMAARIALAGLSLLWETPSRALNGFNLNFDRAASITQTTLLHPSMRILSVRKRSHMPHGPWIEPESWETLHARRIVYLSLIGEIIEHFLSPSGLVKRPKLMSTLLQAVLWFHEACREEVDAIAIVKFSASLDSLSMGKGAGGIRRLIGSRLGARSGSVITKDGRTVNHVIDEIYGSGRNLTIHGTNYGIAHDWTGTRDLAESLARQCLVQSIDWAVSHPDEDSPEKLSR